MLLRLRRQRQSRHKRLHYYVIGGQKVCMYTYIMRSLYVDRSGQSKNIIYNTII